MKALATGTNRTGIATASREDRQGMESIGERTLASSGDGAGIAEARRWFAEQTGAVGSIPPPAAAGGMVKSAVGKLTGERMAILLDRLAERLAFERTGSRFYEGLIAKYQAAQEVGLIGGDGPALEQLAKLHDDEVRHFAMLRTAIVDLGGDPTAQTPSADVTGVLASGIGPVINDPRTDFWQALEAILVAELADNDGWQMLIDLAVGLGHEDLAARFAAAKADEDEHLASVREWLSTHALQEAGASA